MDSTTVDAARKHNARAPFHRFSNEIIGNIFVALSYVDPPSLARPEGWYLRVNGVCSLWRGIALSCVELWARSVGSFVSKPLIDLVIERARTVDLSLDGRIEELGNADRVLDDYQLSLIEIHVDRLRSFSHDSYRDWADVLYRLRTFPKLEMARIWDDSGPCMWHDIIEAPRLHTLYMNNGLIPFHAPALRYLRVDMDNPDWRLSRDVFGSYEPVTEGCLAIPRVFPTREFIALLQRSPGLEQLVVMDMPHLLAEHLPNPFQLYAALPHLRALHLCGSSLAMGDFWQRIRIPSNAQVFIDTETTLLGGGIRFDPVLIDARQRHWDSSQYDCLRLGVTLDYEVQLQLWSSDTDIGNDLSPSTFLNLGLLNQRAGPGFMMRVPQTRHLRVSTIAGPVHPSNAAWHRSASSPEAFMARSFHMEADKDLQLTSTYNHVDITDVPYLPAEDYLVEYPWGAYVRDAWVSRLLRSPEGSPAHLIICWSLFNRLSNARRQSEYISDNVEKLTIVNFPSAAFPSHNRYDEAINEDAWREIRSYLVARSDSGRPPLTLVLAESTSDRSNMERSEEPEYIHTLEGSYANAVRAVTEKGYRSVARILASFEDLRVHTLDIVQ